MHPEYKKGDLDSPEMTPVPQCVDELLKKAVYPRASSDPSIESATRQRRARGVISVLALHREKLFDLYSKLGGNVEVKQKKKEGGEGGEKQRKDSWPMVGAPEPTVGLGLDEWLKLMEESCQGWSRRIALPALGDYRRARKAQGVEGRVIYAPSDASVSREPQCH